MNIDSERDISAFNEIYKEIAEIVGFENALKLYGHFKGQQITFPIRLYSRDHVKNQMLREYNGQNTKSLARLYGYSERWIKELLKDASK